MTYVHPSATGANDVPQVTCALCGFGLPARNTGLCPTCTVRVDRYMAQGVVRFLAHPRTRDALTLALAQERPIHPEKHAERVLVYLARVAEQLDGLDCGTPEVETSLEPVTGDELASLDVWLSQATGR